MGKMAGWVYERYFMKPLSSQMPFGSSADATFVLILRIRMVGFSQVRTVLDAVLLVGADV
jgi:hypothetical protein